jgi:hypothetical protein
MPTLRGIVCWVMIAVFPAFLFAADAGGAMLYGKGAVWLNNSPLPNSSAIFSGDLIRTERESVANFKASGFSVVIQTDSLVKFEETEVSLEHGSLSVTTSNGMAARAMGVTVSPVANTWTEFEVTDVNGTVEIIARKGDVNVQCGKDSVTLPEGQRATREESGKCSRKKGGAYPPTSGDLLTNRYVAGGLIGGGIWTICLLLCSEGSPPPVIPSKP